MRLIDAEEAKQFLKENLILPDSITSFGSRPLFSYAWSLQKNPYSLLGTSLMLRPFNPQSPFGFSHVNLPKG